MSAITEQTIVADVVLEHPETTGVFEAHGIDFCCGGRQSIGAACARRKESPRRVIEALEEAIDRGETDWKARDPRQMSTPALIARIIDEHHGYLRESLPETRRLMEKAAAVHGPHDARLLERRGVVARLDDAIAEHLDYEESVLFPVLMSTRPGARAAARERLLSMYDDHVEVGAALARIHDLSDHFQPPAWACPTYRALLARLKSLQRDTHQHVHLENNVLMPRFIGPTHHAGDR